MTMIEAALQRAKARAQQLRESGDPSHAGDTSANSRRRRLDVTPPAALPQFKFAPLPIDARLSERNRILLTPASSGRAAGAALDAYRILRTRLRRRLPDDDAATLGIVSVAAGEGKSVTSLNLALAFAREKRRNVFLLDLDLRNPSMCRKLGVVPSVEIGNYLSNPTDPAAVFFSIGVENLILAGGTTVNENSSELLGSGTLLKLLDYIKHADPRALVLVDLPPLLHSADALVVAPHLTSTLLVVCEGVTRRDQLERVNDLLSGLNVAGVVLNRSREASADYYG